MRVLTVDIPASTMPLSGGDRLSSPKQIEDICDEVIQRVEKKAREDAKAALRRLGKSDTDFKALFGQQVIDSGAAPAGYRVKTVTMTRDVMNDLAAANPSNPEIPALTVQILRNNIANGVRQFRDLVSAAQGNGQWFLWGVNKIADAKHTVQIQNVGTAMDSVEGLRAQRVVAPDSASDEAQLSDTVVPQYRNVLRYDLMFIDITGRVDVDHNQKPISTAPTQDAGAAAIDRLAAILGGKPEAEPAATEGAPMHHRTREKVEREAREALLASLPQDLRKQAEAVLAAKK